MNRAHPNPANPDVMLSPEERLRNPTGAPCAPVEQVWHSPEVSAYRMRDADGGETFAVLGRTAEALAGVSERLQKLGAPAAANTVTSAGRPVLFVPTWGALQRTAVAGMQFRGRHGHVFWCDPNEPTGGGMSLLYPGWHVPSGRRVFVKTGRAAAQDVWVRREIEVYASIVERDPNAQRWLCAPIDSGLTDHGRPFLALPRFDMSLDQWASQPGRSVAELLDALYLSASALVQLHTVRGERAEDVIVHRDIKPGNLFVRTGPPLGVVLGDFGAARESTAEDIRTGTRVFTRDFGAPEQEIPTPGGPDTSWDVHALGVTVFFVLTRGTMPSATRPERRRLTPQAARLLQLHDRGPGGRTAEDERELGVLQRLPPRELVWADGNPVLSDPDRALLRGELAARLGPQQEALATDLTDLLSPSLDRAMAPFADLRPSDPRPLARALQQCKTLMERRITPRSPPRPQTPRSSPPAGGDSTWTPESDAVGPPVEADSPRSPVRHVGAAPSPTIGPPAGPSVGEPGPGPSSAEPDPFADPPERAREMPAPALGAMGVIAALVVGIGMVWGAGESPTATPAEDPAELALQSPAPAAEAGLAPHAPPPSAPADPVRWPQASAAAGVPPAVTADRVPTVAGAPGSAPATATAESPPLDPAEPSKAAAVAEPMCAGTVPLILKTKAADLVWTLKAAGHTVDHGMGAKQVSLAGEGARYQLSVGANGDVAPDTLTLAPGAAGCSVSASRGGAPVALGERNGVAALSIQEGS